MSFIKIGVWEANALIGFVSAFLLGRYWLYLEAWGWPRSQSRSSRRRGGRFERAQARLDEKGISVDLLALLMQPASP